MAEGKKSVLLYCDIIHTVEELEDDEAGRLFKHYLRYINDQNPEPPDKLTKIVFEPIKQTLKRDLKKYEAFVEKQSLNGKRGGRPNKADETQKTQAFSEKPKKADSGIDKDKVIDKDIILPIGEKNVFNAEEEILKNPIEIERICMKVNFTDKKNLPDVLRKFHLHLESNDKYPQNKKQVFAGFEKWLMTEIKFLKNGHPSNSAVGKLGTSAARVEAARNF
jgi:hypothetical protein